MFGPSANLLKNLEDFSEILRGGDLVIDDLKSGEIISKGVMGCNAMCVWDVIP